MFEKTNLELIILFKGNEHTAMEHVTLRETKDNLSLYHYDDQASHPSNASFYKGVVMEGSQVVARSFTWAPTIVGDSSMLDPSLTYTPFQESTVLRFYKYGDQCMVSTHSHIDIVGTNSRVGTGRPFMELVKQAIDSWPKSYTNETISYRGEEMEIERITPSKWQDLCVDGYVQVFLLVDKSNQVTDLTDLRTTIEDIDEEGNIVTRIIDSPKLYYAMSLSKQSEDDNLLTPSLEQPLQFTMQEHGLVPFMQQVPKLPLMGIEEAAQLIDMGGAVVGFSPETPDRTVKFYSPEYNRKWELANGEFNVIHQWHVLMDSSPSDAAEFLEHTPLHQKKYTMQEMQDINLQYLSETSSFLADIVMKRIQNKDATLPPKIFNYTLETNYKVSNLIADEKKASQINPSLNEIEASITEYIASLPYTKQHSLRGNIVKAKAGRL